MPTRVVHVNFARQLERERDAARDGFVMAVDEMVQAQSQLREAKRERDEAREFTEHWKIEYEIVEDRLRGKKHQRDNGIISEEEIIPKLTRERDEAIAARKASAAGFLEQIQNAEKRVKEAQEIAACALIQRDGILNEYLNRK